MRRADRLFEIIQILRRVRRPVSAQAIADELEVSKRSVYRDIATLTAQRVPIRGEAGVGYVLEEGFDMPPLMLTPEEIDAAVLGALWVSTRAEPELARAAENLIAKIEAITPRPLRRHIAAAAMSVRPVSPASEDKVDAAMLRQAILEGRKVSLGYRDGDGRESKRVVWPVLLGYRDEGRILAAWCELRQGFRYFRTDRMTFAEALDQRYPESRGSLKDRWRKAMDAERESYFPRA
ncbi:Bifunctional ligase/repressor BirA [Labrenzia sp. THAF191b]|uniref:helix-turn-helix transcriptional regulator n=1 Tax=unclassified Labrenzia TaxID=2648686 RepID=UPI001267F837|nr:MULTISPECIES: YafY family protein [unclassified Labrenzia]QFS96377.1 Bifunctional ligase/repressor BirA [Labrenzia sp. THAF191b]QFT02692.1 Bifunctional ligase/repressor BirA [Labrenzia sp. THAF191a]QFT14234.1 Bifunctional ligase/repressor BirA [Labrenzia sp. THAF187b]